MLQGGVPDSGTGPCPRQTKIIIGIGCEGGGVAVAVVIQVVVTGPHLPQLIPPGRR